MQYIYIYIYIYNRYIYNIYIYNIYIQYNNITITIATRHLVETGLLDFHLITLTVMRKSFKKISRRIIIIGVSNNSLAKHLEKF